MHDVALPPPRRAWGAPTDMSKTAPTENATGTANRTTTLHYVPTAEDPKLHVDGNCKNLTQTDARTATTIAADADGDLCQICAPEECLEELQPDTDPTATCAGCGAGIYPGTTQDWRHTPQGRRACPDCGTIPADDQRDQEEMLIADGGVPRDGSEFSSTEELTNAMRRDRARTRPNYKRKYRRKQVDFALAVGLLIGIAIGALWEAIRR